MPDRSDELPEERDALRARIADLERRCRDLESVHNSFLRVSQALSAKAGDEFFQSLVAHLSHSLGMECVTVAQVIDDRGERMRTSAMAIRGRVVPNVEYALRDTPCETIFGRELSYYAEGVCRLFPKDQMLLEMRAESYIGAPLFDRSGKPLGLVAAIDTKPLAHPQFVASIFAMLAARVADELQRQQTEQRLHASEERLRLAVTAGRVGCWDYDILSNRVRNSADFALLTEVAEYPAIADFEDFLALLHPDDRKPVADAVARSIRERTPYEAEFRVARPDGTVRWLADKGQVYGDAQGRAERMVGVTIDIHDRKQAEIALRESEERARIAFAAAGMGAYDWSVGAKKSNYFGNMMALFGRASDDERSGFADFLQSIHPDDRPGVDTAVQRAFREGHGYDVEFRAVWPDGSLHWIAEKGTVLQNAAGQPVRIIGIAMDVDERKRLELDREQLEARVQQAQKLEMLGTLAGGVAHDFNNILQAILSHAGLIRELAERSPVVLRCVEQIETAIQRASELTQQLLAYAGKARFVVEPVDVSQLALETANLLEASLPPGARVLGQFPPGLPAVEGDPTQVRQVIMNLVLNAAEALAEGRGVIRLATGVMHLSTEELAGLILGAGLTEGTYAYCEVCDTGCGMTDDGRARIFDPFYTTKDKGRGLGLAAVLGIVRGHRGAMQVHSELGTGSVFRVLFPASQKPAKHPFTPGSGPSAERPPRRTILVVDDEPAIRESAKLLLEVNGFAVVTAGDGSEALQIFQARPAEFAAILLDLTMPHMGGAEAFRELRAVRADVPILVTSGYSEDEAARHIQNDGRSAFIQKPYRNQQLRATLEQMLERTGAAASTTGHQSDASSAE